MALLRTTTHQVIHDSIRHKAAGDHAGGQTGAGMCAGSHEVQILVTRMPVGWPEVGHLSQPMR